MFWSKLKEIRWGAVTPSLIYILIIIVPMVFYPIEINGSRIDLRTIRDISFYSFAVIICSFLQKNIWLSLFMFWCVFNWWANFFIPSNAYVGLTGILSALIIYITMKHLLSKKILSSDTILRIICNLAIFQFIWIFVQKFSKDPIFYNVTQNGDPLNNIAMIICGWSGNPSLLGVFFAITAFLLLDYYKVKGFPIVFFIILSSLLIIKNFTTALCFLSGGMFYITYKYWKSKKYIVLGIVTLLLLISGYIYYVKKPNFDRLFLWKALIKFGLKVRPIIGRGINFFSTLNIIDKTGTPWKEVHNEYLQIFFELGGVGLFLFLGFIYSKFREFFSKVRNNKQLCIMSCLVAYIVSGVSLFPFHIAQLSFIAIMLLVCLEDSYSVADSISTVSS